MLKAKFHRPILQGHQSAHQSGDFGHYDAPRPGQPLNLVSGVGRKNPRQALRMSPLGMRAFNHRVHRLGGTSTTAGLVPTLPLIRAQKPLDLTPGGFDFTSSARSHRSPQVSKASLRTLQDAPDLLLLCALQIQLPSPTSHRFQLGVSWGLKDRPCRPIGTSCDLRHQWVRYQRTVYNRAGN